MLGIRSGGYIYSVGLHSNVAHIHEINEAVGIFGAVGHIENFRNFSVVFDTVALSFGKVKHFTVRENV